MPPVETELNEDPDVSPADAAHAYAPAAWLAITGLAVVGCLSIWFIAAANTLVQLAVDPGLRGRMMALWTMALPGSSLATGPLAGWVTQDAGPRVGFSLSGLALAVVALAGWHALTRTNPALPLLPLEEASH